MPACNKELNIFKEFRGTKIALTLHCIQGEGHEGKHEWHIWTDGENKLQESGRGITKTIN